MKAFTNTDLKLDIQALIEEAIKAHKNSGNPPKDAASIYAKLVMDRIKEYQELKEES